MIESVLFTDPQIGVGHYCANCLREMFGNNELCPKCLDRLDDDEIIWED